MYEGQTCGRSGKLTTKKRDRLPDKAFGLPSERKYPMPDPDHAASAKGRAKTQLNKGNLTRAQYDKVVRKANSVIRACGGQPNSLSGTKRKRGSAGAAGAVFVVAGAAMIWFGVRG